MRCCQHAVPRPWAYGRVLQAGQACSAWRLGYHHLATPALSLCFWSIETGDRLSPGIGPCPPAGYRRGNEVTAPGALWCWSIAMAGLHATAKGCVPGTQEMHDCGDDEFIVLGTYLLLHSLNQLIQICGNSR